MAGRPVGRCAVVWVSEPGVSRDRLQELADAGLDGVQWRDPARDARALWTQADACRGLGLAVVVNDRVDVATAARAGVQLGWRSLPVAVVRAGHPHAWIGCSVHDLGQARAAADGGADYLVFGHVHPTSSKPGLAPKGLDALARIVASVDLPVLAIGGITPENVGAVLLTGCAGVAVRSLLRDAPRPVAAMRALRRAADASAWRPQHELVIRGEVGT